MQKPVKIIPSAEVMEIQQVNMNVSDWDRRMIFLEWKGTLRIYESPEHSGEYVCDAGYFCTTRGTYTIDRDCLTMKTKNSIYKFRIISDES